MPGVKTRFGSMVPEEVDQERQKVLTEKAQKERLEKQAGFLGVLNAQASKELVKMIDEKLTARVEELVKNDSQAKSYIEILKELGVKQGAARKAAKELQDKYFKIEK